MIKASADWPAAVCLMYITSLNLQPWEAEDNSHPHFTKEDVKAEKGLSAEVYMQTCVRDGFDLGHPELPP